MFTRNSLLAGAIAAAAPLIALAPSALAETCGGGYDLLTAKVSDSTPASGQEFILHGKLFEMGMPGKDHKIRIQSRSAGSWHAVAHVRTNEDGKYRSRLILSTTGRRVLRVIAVGQGDEQNLHQRFVVNVH